jgi:hypothetical protein
MVREEKYNTTGVSLSSIEAYLRICTSPAKAMRWVSEHSQVNGKNETADCMDVDGADI